MNQVVVIGGDHHNTLGVIESFAQTGIKSNVIIYSQHTRSYVLHSKYIKLGWLCRNEEQIINCLLTNFKDKKLKTVVIATNDETASLIDRNHKILDDFCILPNATPGGKLSDIMSKEFMSDLARKVGMTVPQSWIIKDANIPDNIEFPVITKAISSVEGSKDNIRVIYNKEELDKFICTETHCSVIQVSKFVNKDFEFQLLGCSINSGEHIIIPGRTHIDRPYGMDNTFFLRFDECEDELNPLIGKAMDFVRLTKYSGLFSIEFLRDKDGKDYFTEMNFRNDGNAYCVTASGCNIPYIYYLGQTGKDYQAELEKSKVCQTYLMPEVYYFTRMLAGEVGFKEWVRNMRKTTCYTTYFPNDKRVFFWFVWYEIRNRIVSKFRK